MLYSKSWRGGWAGDPGLHHAQIKIPEDSEDTARDFYCRLLDLKEIENPESLAGLRRIR